MMVPIMRRRFTAVLISLVVFSCQWLLAAPAHAAMDVAKQVLIGADYSNKDLRGATFNLSNLREANLSGSDLRGASLYGAKLQDADLTKAQLQKANLEQANLAGATLVDANLACATLPSADLTKADLNGVIERMPKHKPPRPPATSAKGAWRASAVATAVGKAIFTQLAQSDDDDDDDADGAESESDSEGDAAETPTPWQEQVETAVKQAVEGLVAVAKPTLALVETMIKELASLFDALSKGIPLVLVRLVQDHPAHKLEIAVAQHLRTLLHQALVDPFFDNGLPGMVQALAKQLQEVMRWVNGEAAELDLSSMVAALLIDLQSAHHAIVDGQQRLLGDLLKTAGGVDAADGAAAAEAERAAKEGGAPLLQRRVVLIGLFAHPELNEKSGVVAAWDGERQRYLVLLDGTSEKLALNPGNLKDMGPAPASDAARAAKALAPPQAAPAERPGGGDASGNEKRGPGATPALDEGLRSFAAEVLSGLMESQIKQLTDRQQAPSRLKMAAERRVEAFATDAAAPIADSLANLSLIHI